ncbi:helix-turn-helix domain-containing protein [Clostridium beijerinckii]|uniref:helix-turn-helix domain-containing protein n=1 Tax=Clostridium beijerinckii TaxID=1520 RepID=UPI0012B180FA|nr:helix-turn-helix transcriptional regulator [Clostridium beijerinckii]MRY42657.1 helix-turn-helix domain-containing protein [Parabacteroides distasonis]MZK52131.1 helix-turn-helix domain-containing protein [Clostridium beijerinckii]MZK61695.1 helix-turn-helix domain-containing protein [Clostridium beijerinckii]MZK71491.1 helix-turn-helix domain-containing protein [Clostridium beijerinckii]MZK76850.1 helix-turn-helix domain-containing protein [Clostridium beijerinckii]
MKKDILINNINKFIKAKGIKQNWIADMLDMNTMTINNILNFKSKRVDLDELENIANVLDLTIDELSKEDFQAPKDVFDDLTIQEPVIAFCGNVNIQDKDTIDIIENLIGIINVMDSVKTANKKMKSLEL